jgi:hypothetical protein
MYRRSTPSRVPRRRALAGAVAAFALVLVAGACGSSSHPAANGPGTVLASTTTTARATTTTAPIEATVPGVGTIRLDSETGVTPTELKRADTLIASTITDLRRFRTPAEAYAAGYRSIGDAVTGDEHFVNWAYVTDGHILDPQRPESIVYEYRNGAQTAVAAMYMLPFGSTFANVPDVGGPLTQWHVHRDLCLTNNPQQKVVAGLTSVDGGCPAGTSKAGNTPMLHVWAVPNPCGPFAALEGIGAGQVPAGQTRNCDTRNASVR